MTRLGQDNIRCPAPAQPVLGIALVAVSILCGCAAYKPAPASYQPQLGRVLTETNGPIIASVAVLNRSEAKRKFGLPLDKRRIQPVWLRLQNTSTNKYYFLPAGLDPDYHTPSEVAYMFRKVFSPGRNHQIEADLKAQGLPLALNPTSSVEGFVFSNYDPGAKLVRVKVLGDENFYALELAAPVPGRALDYERVNFEGLYEGDAMPDYSLAKFREILETLPPTTTDKPGKGEGDPLNLVVVTDENEQIGRAFLRNNWDATEVLTFGNVFRLIGSFLFSTEWRTSPVSPLYVFGRPQDLALQKARTTIHQRNHLRLWLAPFKVEGRYVLVGQISRDIGLRFTFKAPGFWTHKIDPFTDEARDFVAQEMVLSGSVRRLAWVGGVGPKTEEAPGRNLTGDPWWTDGLRVVLFLTAKQVEPDQVDLLDWRSIP